MEEIWKDIKGWEGYYQVSNYGNVRGLPIKTKFGNRTKHYPLRNIRSYISLRGYKIVVFSKAKKSYTKNVHRLVAEAFIPNPNNYPCIDHVDTDKLNNNANNLRWCTHKGNSMNPLTRLHQSCAISKKWKEGVFDKRNNLHYQRVAQYTKDGQLVKIWDSITEAANALNICGSSITCVCRGRNHNRHTVGGYSWKYVGNYYMKNM